MKEKFIEWNPSTRSLGLVKIINRILEEYREQGYRLTLRQLYYQLVARDIIANKVEEYNSLGNVVSKGRLSGLIDWEMIEDRIRVPTENSHWENPEQILKAASNSYYQSRWENQKNYIEVWCEKDAVSNIIQPICSKWDVLFMANRGYSSQSAMYDGYRRLDDKLADDKDIMVIYLGDHDPSGIDMTNDIKNRLGTFFFCDKNVKIGEVERIALNMNQVEEYNPPENPAKITDSRYNSYVQIYGISSWELDALEPSVLSKIAEDAIMRFIDLDEFNKVEKVEAKHKKNLLGLTKYLQK